MNLLTQTWGFIKRDFNTYPARFCAEAFAWSCSVVSAVMFAMTAPNIPIVPLYCIFIAGCCASAWSCYTRGSFGLMINSIFLITIDSFGLIRMLLK